MKHLPDPIGTWVRKILHALKAIWEDRNFEPALELVPEPIQSKVRPFVELLQVLLRQEGLAGVKKAVKSFERGGYPEQLTWALNKIVDVLDALEAVIMRRDFSKLHKVLPPPLDEIVMKVVKAVEALLAKDFTDQRR